MCWHFYNSRVSADAGARANAASLRASWFASASAVLPGRMSATAWVPRPMQMKLQDIKTRHKAYVKTQAHCTKVSIQDVTRHRHLIAQRGQIGRLGMCCILRRNGHTLPVQLASRSHAYCITQGLIRQIGVFRIDQSALWVATYKASSSQCS